jgi:hypothetical protein
MPRLLWRPGSCFLVTSFSKSDLTAQHTQTLEEHSGKSVMETETVTFSSGDDVRFKIALVTTQNILFTPLVPHLHALPPCKVPEG